MARRSLPGRLFVLEGPDGVGKSTFVRALGEHLRSNGHDLLELSFPGKVPGSLGELVYRVHHDEGPLRVANISLLAKQALHVAAHIDAIDRQIVPALKRGQTVLLRPLLVVRLGVRPGWRLRPATASRSYRCREGGLGHSAANACHRPSQARADQSP